ncbi:nicotinate (nicotinamide) nucleotide adenylyltransferase [Nitratiruptor tergarcus]|uniref:Probable nicotinate-nucleotide adenylyltransferase n=1 Tax=Nitratiruptor tergarcus DSM 16512 TaxID=1069081 RepID=A0A1W1WQ13_9BACT|nr:nicotinate (nicotinamide) nucleotide adenylyltransferase [Nitratiruptor tergarcus]SMC08299.1 nicotinate-nucleotide adenylyltransferase [Nitratiruptor tergarcus DSM 16512]
MRIAIFGGSFDPPHKGHLQIAKIALEQLDIDYLIIVPTYLNPFKHHFAAPPTLRLRWLKKIFLYQKRVKICDFEIRQGRVTYAIETVTYIKKRFAPKKIYYIIGSDNLEKLHLWKSYKKLKKEVEFVVATRKGFKIKGDFKKLLVDIPISSTQLRQKPIKRFLPPIVANEIIRFYHS